MTDYEHLVKALRCTMKHEKVICAIKECSYNKGKRCKALPYNKLFHDAAAAIEELLSFAHYVANKVTMSDEDWEDYHEAFTEVACRKLVKLGVISIENDMYVYRQDEPQEVQE